MRILIVNDDGIDTLGIKLLATWAKKYGEVTVVAPKVEQSGKSQAIEFVQPVEIKKVPFIEGVTAYSMDSTPADCVRYGFVGLNQTYDLVLSGINRGVNVGSDIVYSGTVGAIFEAGRFKVPSIAFSAFPDGQEEAAKHFDEVYQYILANNLFNENLLYNVNIPHNPQGIKLTYEGSAYFSDMFIKKGEDLYLQDGVPLQDEHLDDCNRDTVAIHKGFISISPLIQTRTCIQAYQRLKAKGL